MTVRSILLVIVIIALFTGPAYGWHAWGPNPSIGLGGVLLIILLLMLFGIL